MLASRGVVVLFVRFAPERVNYIPNHKHHPPHMNTVGSFAILGICIIQILRTASKCNGVACETCVILQCITSYCRIKGKVTHN